MSPTLRDRSAREARAYADAAEWLLVLQKPEPTDEEFRQFEEWLNAEPLHRHAYDFVERAWRRKAAYGRIRRPTASELHNDDYDGAVPIAIHLARRSAGHSRASKSIVDRLRGMKNLMVAAAVVVFMGAAVVIAVNAWLAMAVTEQVQVHETGTAQHREVRLADGSIVTLGAKTSVSVSYANDRRTIVLDRGTALFEVAHDKHRPFVVLAGGGQVTALGTVFSIRRDEDEVTVSVADGKVQVDEKPAPLSPILYGDPPARSIRSGKTAVLVEGERIRYESQGNLGAVERVDPSLAIAWRSGLLAYRDEPLLHVIRDLNRYSQRQIVLGDRAAEEMRFTGTVQVSGDQSGIEQWLAALQAILPLEVVPDRRQIIIRARASS